MASEDEPSVDDLFTELPADGRRALEEVGMGLPELRRVAAREDGMRQVRGILSEFTTTAHPPRRPGDDEGPARRTALMPWVRLLLVAVAGVVLCGLSTLLLHEAAVLVGAVCGLGVVWAAFKTRQSHGGLVLRWITVAAYVVLVVVGSFFSQQWYLRLSGVEQTATIATPRHQWEHGTQETYCRVRLRDGSVEDVLGNRQECAGRAGFENSVVADPSGHYRPFLGKKSEIGGTLGGAVAIGAGAVLILAPVSAMVSGRARRNRRT